MNATARLLAPLVGMLLLTSCGHLARTSRVPSPAPLPAGALLPSQNLLVGRVIAVDLGRGFAFVELASSSPSAALADGSQLVARTDDLRETARLSPSRYVRGRTLGAKILSGQPNPGDEVAIPPATR